MRLDDFAVSPSGQLVPTVLGATAFVPDPLPPQIDLARIARQSGNARLAIGELRGASRSRSLRNPYLLISPLQRREALTSSAMEGTFTTVNDLVLAEAGIEPQSADTVEVANYIAALHHALDAMKTLPISHRLLRDAHRILLTNTVHGRGAQKRPGEYKVEQNWIDGATVTGARFVPPPPLEASAGMDALERWINRPDAGGADALIDMALVHYQFEAIHPFADGNGRLGRLLVTLMAMSTGLLRLPILYLSPVIERRKDEYIDRLYAVSARSAWEEWVAFFLDVVTESCNDTIARIDRLDDLYVDYTARVRARSNSANDARVLDMLFRRPVVRLTQISEHLALSPQGARNVVDRLTASGILRELQGHYPKVFYAPDILAISDR
jgi:Fic family protein